MEARREAEKLRKDGNFYFRTGRCGAAIDAYTEAIALCPDVPILWTNRALAYRKNNEWSKVESDCQRAIELDHNFPKAHYVLGLALLQREEYAEGVKELQRALDLARCIKQNGNMEEEIWMELARAKYLRWEHESTKRSWELQSLKEACETALKEKHFLDDCETEGLRDEIASAHLKQLEALQKVFEKAAEEDTPTEVPDYLCCRIALEIFRDPVTTPSGVTYERAMILEHLKKGGSFDPVTHVPLNEQQLVPNLAIKEAVRAFLDKHGWAYKTG